MEAKLCANPSLIWRSIYGARSLLKGGLFWRVGNGYTISIWQDKWLDDSRLLFSRNLEDDVFRDTKVSALINKEACFWISAIIIELLGEDMVDVMCKIPFSRFGLQDKLI